MVAEVSLMNVLCVTELSAVISGAAVGMMNVTELSTMISGAAVAMTNVTAAMISRAVASMIL
jgi:hypothetical protein